MRKYKLKVQLYHDNLISDNGQIILRYYMIGIYDKKNKFTGVVQDYTGGGNYEEVYFLNGENLSFLENEYGDRLYEGFDEIIEKINEKYPELIKEIESFLLDIGDYDEEIFVYTLKKSSLKYFDKGGNYRDGIIDPIEIGNTYFKERD